MEGEGGSEAKRNISVRFRFTRRQIFEGLNFKVDRYFDYSVVFGHMSKFLRIGYHL